MRRHLQLYPRISRQVTRVQVVGTYPDQGRVGERVLAVLRTHWGADYNFSLDPIRQEINAMRRDEGAFGGQEFDDMSLRVEGVVKAIICFPA